jgi:hypothetical protein
MNGRIPLPSPASRARKRGKRLRSGHRFPEVGREAGCNFSDVQELNGAGVNPPAGYAARKSELGQFTD